MTDLDRLDAPSDTVTWVLTSEQAKRYTVAVNEYDRLRATIRELVAAARERDELREALDEAIKELGQAHEAALHREDGAGVRQDDERPGTYVGHDGREYEHAD